MTYDPKTWNPYSTIPPLPKIGILSLEKPDCVYEIPETPYRSIGEPSRALLCPHCGNVWKRFILLKDGERQSFLPVSSPCKECRPEEGGRAYSWMSDDLLAQCPLSTLKEEWEWLNKWGAKIKFSPDWYFSSQPRSQ